MVYMLLQKYDDRLLRNVTLSCGPQHPSAYGVLRQPVEIDGEDVVKADSHVGLSDRYTEKWVEYNTSIRALPYFDRLDYVFMMVREHRYSLAVGITFF